MMAAATINETAPEADVFLIEKNEELGKKVLISGGGRCNLTTGITEVKTLLTKYPRGSKFLSSTMYNFPPAAVRAWFEEHGVPLKCEDDLRVFPVSNKGADVVNVFKEIFFTHKTKVLFGHAVKAVKKIGQNFVITFEKQEPLEVDRLILCLGGQAYRHTGSTGDGYGLAESLGHHVTTLAPSLHSFITKEKWVSRLAGVSFPEAVLTAPQPVARERRVSYQGPFLFTHRGLSGPAVFALSSLLAFEPISRNMPLVLKVDLLPSSNSSDLLAKLEKEVKGHPRKSFKNILQRFVPLSVAEILCEECKIPLDKNNAEISNEEKERAVRWLKHLPLQIILRGAGDEFVTAGGVELSEVDPRTMESKNVPGLFFAGEILNIDGFTGGFNLQAAWATGRLAGLNSYN